MPYVFVFGNHDAEADLTRQQIMDLDGYVAGCSCDLSVDFSASYGIWDRVFEVSVLLWLEQR